MSYRLACALRTTPVQGRLSSITPVPPQSRRASRTIHGLITAILLGGLVGGCHAPPCTTLPLATLPLLDEPTGLYVPVAIDGRAVKLLLDTGSSQSLLTSETVRRLGLSTEHLLDDTDVLIGFALTGVGGRRHIDRAWTHRVDLGAAPVLAMPFSVVLSRNTGWDTAGDGILGMDVLSGFDLDLDVARLRLTLYSPGGMCAPPSGSGPHAVRLLTDMSVSGPHMKVTIAGHAFDALIDTGAQQSSIMAYAASRLGASASPSASAPRFDILGTGVGHATAVMHDFHDVSLGDIALPRLPMAVISASGLTNPEVILGDDVLRTVHAWLSARSRTLMLAAR